MLDTAKMKDLLVKRAKELQNTASSLRNVVWPTPTTLQVQIGPDLDLSIAAAVDAAPKKCTVGGKESDFIYILSVAKNSETTIASLVEKLRSAKKEAANLEAKGKPFFKYPAVPKKKQIDTLVLYVGRAKNLSYRISQHFGSGINKKTNKPYKTFALYMQSWIDSDYANIEITFLEFIGEEDDIMQHIENALWDGLSPAFGRRGAK